MVQVSPIAVDAYSTVLNPHPPRKMRRLRQRLGPVQRQTSTPPNGLSRPGPLTAPADDQLSIDFLVQPTLFQVGWR
jgi:hypothetical protein